MNHPSIQIDDFGLTINGVRINGCLLYSEGIEMLKKALGSEFRKVKEDKDTEYLVWDRLGLSTYVAYTGRFLRYGLINGLSINLSPSPQIEMASGSQEISEDDPSQGFEGTLTISGIPVTRTSKVSEIVDAKTGVPIQLEEKNPYSEWNLAGNNIGALPLESQRLQVRICENEEKNRMVYVSVNFPFNLTHDKRLAAREVSSPISRNDESTSGNEEDLHRETKQIQGIPKGFLERIGEMFADSFVKAFSTLLAIAVLAGFAYWLLTR